MKQGPHGPLICFGKIRRDPLTMMLVLDEIEGHEGAVGTIVGRNADDVELMMALERLLVTAPTKDGSNACGPMFWSFKKAVSNAIEAGV
jgi:hypothetical protein